MSGRRFRWCCWSALWMLVACGSDETVTPVAPQPVMPGTPTAALPGTNPNAAAGQVPNPIAPGPAGQPGQGSNYGTITLSTGFTPDPHIASGVAGGVQNASGFGAPGCRGHVSTTPDHLLVAASSFANMRILVRSPQDTTLVIQKPDGSYICDDDTEGRDPVVQTILMPGTYKIYVGSYRSTERPNYTIGFSEVSSVMPSSLPAPAQTAAPQGPAATAEQIVTLRRGFMPDPKVVMGQTTGTVDAQAMGPGCRGFVGLSPNHTLVLQSDSPNMRVMARSETDTMLAIRRPDGSVVCNDDGANQGTNPLLAQPFTAGTYQIYVGTYHANTTASYRLGFSEMGSVDTDDI